MSPYRGDPDSFEGRVIGALARIETKLEEHIRADEKLFALAFSRIDAADTADDTARLRALEKAEGELTRVQVTRQELRARILLVVLGALFSLAIALAGRIIFGGA